MDCSCFGQKIDSNDNDKNVILWWVSETKGKPTALRPFCGHSFTRDACTSFDKKANNPKCLLIVSVHVYFED